jgi:hypothetical protein
MGRPYLLVALLAVCLLLTGSTQTYVQTFDSSGNSMIVEQKDMSSYLQSYPVGSLDRLAAACSASPSLGCSVEGTIITITLKMTPDSGYYAFQSSYGLPFITSTATVGKIPSDLFDSALNQVFIATDLTNSSSSAKAVDLADKATDARLSAAWKSVGINETYTMVMPNGYSETYDLVSLLADAQPMTATVQELNMGAIVLIVGIIVLAAFAASFFFTKQKKKKGKR